MCKIACRFRQCAGEGTLFYGYKLHAVCGLNEGIHSSGLTKASVHDLHYLKDVKAGYAHCTLLGDKDYASVQVRLDLFESARIRLEAPCRKNQRDRKPAFQPFAKARKRMETVFSQLCDQSMIVYNHAKDTERLFTRIIGKINALTICNTLTTKQQAHRQGQACTDLIPPTGKILCNSNFPLLQRLLSYASPSCLLILPESGSANQRQTTLSPEPNR